MAVRLSDLEIDSLIHEPKFLPKDYRSQIQPRDKRGHKERELDIKKSDGSIFRMILRISNSNPLDFSIILGYFPKESNLMFRLRRYNGKSHEHTNHIEGNTFYDFHIHIATERYQDLGTREDAYTEPTEVYSNFHGAINQMLKECCFETPSGTQPSLFKEM